MPPREEQVDSLLGDEISISEPSQNLVPEDELGLMGIDKGDGLPGSVNEENAASDDGMRVPVQRRPEGLDDDDHAGPSVRLVDGGNHHLTDGFVGESRKLSQQLSMK